MLREQVRRGECLVVTSSCSLERASGCAWVNGRRVCGEAESALYHVSSEAVESDTDSVSWLVVAVSDASLVEVASDESCPCVSALAKAGA